MKNRPWNEPKKEGRIYWNSMGNFELYYYFSGILNTLGKIILLIACIVLYVKQRNGASIMMLVGAVLTIVFAILGFIWNLLAAQVGPESVVKINGIINIIGQLPYILFTIGLLLFCINHIKKKGRGQ